LGRNRLPKGSGGAGVALPSASAHDGTGTNLPAVKKETEKGAAVGGKLLWGQEA
jgi:hypothetical protein